MFSDSLISPMCYSSSIFPVLHGYLLQGSLRSEMFVFYFLRKQVLIPRLSSLVIFYFNPTHCNLVTECPGCIVSSTPKLQSSHRLVYVFICKDPRKPKVCVFRGKKKNEEEPAKRSPGGEMLSNVLLYFPCSSKLCSNKQKLFRMYTSRKPRYRHRGCWHEIWECQLTSGAWPGYTATSPGPSYRLTLPRDFWMRFPARLSFSLLLPAHFGPPHHQDP